MTKNFIEFRSIFSEVNLALSFEIFKVFDNCGMDMLDTIHNDDNCDFIGIHPLSNEAIDVFANSCECGFEHFFILTVHTDTDGEFNTSLLFFE